MTEKIIQTLQIKQPLVKIGLDGGQGSFKVCLSVIDESKADSDEVIDSVKKVFIIFIAFGVQENRFNMRTIWNLLKLDSLSSYIISVDLKMANILIGLMSHSSKFPCSWCLATLIGGEYDTESELRTVAMVNKSAKHIKGIEMDSDDEQDEQDEPDHHFGVVDVPVFDLHCSELILFTVVPPILHLMLGAGNYLVKELEKISPSLCKEYLHACGLAKTANFGKDLNGHGAREFIRKWYILELLIRKGKYEKERDEALQFIEILKQMDKVVNSCFGRTQSHDCVEQIGHLKQMFRSAGWKETPKLHALFVHVPQYLAHKNTGLAHISEHAFESIHRDFNLHYTNYKRSAEHPEFAEKLLQSVASYNSKHLIMNLSI